MLYVKLQSFDHKTEFKYHLTKIIIGRNRVTNDIYMRCMQVQLY